MTGATVNDTGPEKVAVLNTAAPVEVMFIVEILVPRNVSIVAVVAWKTLAVRSVTTPTAEVSEFDTRVWILATVAIRETNVPVPVVVVFPVVTTFPVVFTLPVVVILPTCARSPARVIFPNWVEVPMRVVLPVVLIFPICTEFPF